MEVILREEIEKLGNRGDVVKVAPGYARNFLLPRRMAVLATESNPGDTYAAITSRSYHSGGVNVMFMDGSTRFISNSIDLATWRALATPAGGEIANAP